MCLFLYTVNQLLFATTLFRDLSEMNWFAVTNFRDQALSTPVFHYNFMVNTGPRREIFAKMSRTLIKVSLQYTNVKGYAKLEWRERFY